MQHHRVRSHLLRIALALGVAALAAWALSPHLSFATNTMHPFTLTSPDFTDGGQLPQSVEFNAAGCHGQNIAPTLNWSGVPQGTASFALAVNDYDAPVAGGFHHWILYNIPGGVTTVNGTSPYTQGTNSFGTLGYGGPCPPPNGQTHHYIFTLYALTVPQISGQALTYDQLIQAIAPSVAGATVIVGTFARFSPSE
jgi:Raf kinase inhibitor-like YbhB/YbcL family protein